MKIKIETIINIILILLLPIMTYITISNSPVNISFADLFSVINFIHCYSV